jgi:hypothetical protein
MSADIGGHIMGKTTLGADRQTGLNRSRRRARRLAGTAAVLAAASPFALAAGPAGAVTNNATTTGSLTFVMHTGGTVTCSLQGFSQRDTEGTRRGFASNTSYLTGGSYDERCYGHQYIDASYKDSQGVTQTVNSYSYKTDEGNVGWSAAYSAVKVTHRVTFTQCDANQSATCELSVTTAPK